METKLYVGNLPYSTVDVDLQTLFAQAGIVKSAQVIRDRESGRSKGFGYVVMSSNEEAQSAITMFHGRDFSGRPLTVNFARQAENNVEEGLRQLSISQSNRNVLRVFLCHSSGDKPAVRRLYRQLSNEKWIEPWLDEEEILPGENWDLEIKRAVKRADIVIVCLSRASVNKEGYVQKEIRQALDIADEKPEGTIFVVPLKLESCDVPSRLSVWQWVNYYEEGAYNRLLLSLRKRAHTLGVQIGP